METMQSTIMTAQQDPSVNGEYSEAELNTVDRVGNEISDEKIKHHCTTMTNISTTYPLITGNVFAAKAMIYQ